MNHTAVDPFISLDQTDILDDFLAQPSPQEHREEQAKGPSWQERIWLFLFDAVIALALLFFLSRALPVDASLDTTPHVSIDQEPTITLTQSAFNQR